MWRYYGSDRVKGVLSMSDDLWLCLCVGRSGEVKVYCKLNKCCLLKHSLNDFHFPK